MWVPGSRSPTSEAAVDMLDMVAYWTSKDGTARSDWEDGASYSPRSGWFAIADGASTGSNSREWAYTLVHGFVGDRPANALDDTTSGFTPWIDRTRERFDPDSDTFPRSQAPGWVRAAGEARGSHATLLAGRIADGRIRAVAVGDCCLFLFRASGAVESFPLTSPQSFGSSPQLVSSRGSGKAAAPSARRFERDLGPRDVVFVATDAIAQWLTGQRHETRLWQMLSMVGHHGFERLCADLRATNRMKDDDVTLFRATQRSVTGRA